MFTTPQDFFNTTTKFMSRFPKTLDEVKEVGEKIKRVIEVEQENAKEVVSVYNKAAKGDASMNEIMKANKKAQEVATAARFAAVMAMPGAIFALPFMIEASKEYSFDFVPASVAKEFNI